MTPTNMIYFPNRSRAVETHIMHDEATIVDRPKARVSTRRGITARVTPRPKGARR